MSFLVTNIAGDHRKLIRSHWSAVIGLLWSLSWGAAFAQTGEAAQPCVRANVTASASVMGYVFRAYQTADASAGCVRIYRDGKVVFKLDDNDATRYELGQRADAHYKIPRVPNGADLTGDGRPNMVVTSWSGGAHCCFTHYIFELEPKLRLLATLQDGDSDLAHFERIGGGPGYYYVTSDIWSYWPDSFAFSTSHKVILRWDGDKFRLDLNRMGNPPPTAQQWDFALKAVNDALGETGNTRGALGTTLWNTVLDLIYTGHSDLAWKFVGEASPSALQGENASLGDFCSKLKDSPYWFDLKPTLKRVPQECVEGMSKSKI